MAKTHFWHQIDRNSEKHFSGTVSYEKNLILNASFEASLGSWKSLKKCFFIKVAFRCLFRESVSTRASEGGSQSTFLRGVVADAGVRDFDGPPVYFARFRHLYPSFVQPPCPLFLTTDCNHASDDHLHRFASLLGTPGGPGWAWFRDFRTPSSMRNFTSRFVGYFLNTKVTRRRCFCCLCPVVENGGFQGTKKGTKWSFKG